MHTSPLKVLLSSAEEPTDYTDRPTVKAVVLDEKGRVLLFDGLLLGGGVEEGENLEQAMKRECLEEAGVLIDSLEPLGIVIQYRDAYKKKYIIHGFKARFVEKVSDPTTTSESERKRTTDWFSVSEAEESLKRSIEDTEKSGERDLRPDAYQAELFNTTTSLIFLQEALK